MPAISNGGRGRWKEGGFAVYEFSGEGVQGSRNEALVGRRLRLGDSPLLDSLYNVAVENPSRPFRAVYLFPGTDSSPAIDNSKCQSSLHGSYISKYVLIAFDGTWKHTKEMVQEGALQQVHEHNGGYCTSFCVLEPHGVEIEGRLVEVLRAVVRFQACYLNPMKPRPKLLKRGKEDEKKNQSAVVFGL
ncbi:hypothetical protein RHMOL_Rhmol03G0021100 [Rhododendron molle]|uniref:Uncharacterized protein n=1 Tax=Rhododendron molle TaxID=49168 RepID=A0ACC0PA08_RHOML|nr:hypothetical protein RHMOL_Rhmol03G0021100 [Rhododendron molle]